MLQTPQKDMIRVGIWITPEQKSYLGKLAHDTERSMSHFIRRYIQTDMDMTQDANDLANESK